MNKCGEERVVLGDAKCAGSNTGSELNAAGVCTPIKTLEAWSITDTMHPKRLLPNPPPHVNWR